MTQKTKKVYVLTEKQIAAKREKSRLWYERNKERLRAEAVERCRLNRELYAERAREWQRNNPERNRATKKLWSSNNQELNVAYCHARRARSYNADGRYEKSDVDSMLVAQDHKCKACSKDLKVSGSGKYHVDHIMPLILGGSNWPENLQLLCPSCNLSKGSKHPDDWIPPIRMTL